MFVISDDSDSDLTLWFESSDTRGVLKLDSHEGSWLESHDIPWFGIAGCCIISSIVLFLVNIPALDRFGTSGVWCSIWVADILGLVFALGFLKGTTLFLDLNKIKDIRIWLLYVAFKAVSLLVNIIIPLGLWSCCFFQNYIAYQNLGVY